MNDGIGMRTHPQNREPRVRPQRRTGIVSCLDGAPPGIGSNPSTAAARPLLDPLWQYMRTHLAEACSPEQIAGRLKHAYPDDRGKQCSTETI